MYEFTHTDIQTDRRTDTGRDIVASAMKQIATKMGQLEPATDTVSIKVWVVDTNMGYFSHTSFVPSEKMNVAAYNRCAVEVRYLLIVIAPI